MQAENVEAFEANIDGHCKATVGRWTFPIVEQYDDTTFIVPCSTILVKDYDGLVCPMSAMTAYLTEDLAFDYERRIDQLKTCYPNQLLLLPKAGLRAEVIGDVGYPTIEFISLPSSESDE